MQVETPLERYPKATKVKFAKNVVYGGIAGWVGALTTYPIDRIKNTVQLAMSNAAVAGSGKPSIAGTVAHLLRTEGVRTLYRGLPVQLVGLIPEKALKLSVNDWARGALSGPTRECSMAVEAAAGGMAGAAQVLVTTPYELAKIRLLESGSPSIRAVLAAIAEGGWRGAYRGASACAVRDIFFTSLYFPLMTLCKRQLVLSVPLDSPLAPHLRAPPVAGVADADGKLTLLGRFLGATIAGSVAAFLATPADAVKTNMQSATLKGEKSTLLGLARQIHSRYGVPGLFRGGLGRVVLIGPLFGVVLTTYERLQVYIPM